MRTVEISAQFLALLQIPHVTQRRSLHLSVLHFPSAKFGDYDPPSSLVCWVKRADIDFIPLQLQCRRALCLERVQGSFPSCALTQAAWFFRTEFPPDFPGKGILRVNSKAWS